MSDRVALLTSGMGLGVYVPALFLRNQCEARGIQAQIYVYEDFLEQDKKKNVKKYQECFHKSYRAAVAGHKLPVQFTEHLDEEALSALFQDWREAGQEHFIMLSGHWERVLNNYVSPSGCGRPVECARMDFGVTPSWRGFQGAGARYHTTWLFGNPEERMQYTILADGRPPVAFAEREERYVVHGGGWGMGTYLNRMEELEGLGRLDVTLHSLKEMENAREKNSYYLIDPDWSPWMCNENGRHVFPPTRQLPQEARFSVSEKKPYLYEVCRKALAIISKPGGGTLLDAISTATPVVFLEPIAEHERCNAQFFEAIGCGVSLENWKAKGYSKEVLAALHENLLSVRAGARDYLPAILEKWGLAGAGGTTEKRTGRRQDG